MKTRIKKIIIMAVALLFVSVGVSFADDGKGNSRKAPGNAYGHYKKGHDGHYPGWNKKHPRTRHDFRDRTSASGGPQSPSSISSEVLACTKGKDRYSIQGKRT